MRSLKFIKAKYYARAACKSSAKPLRCSTSAHGKAVQSKTTQG